MNHYWIDITLFRGTTQTRAVNAENANEAVITALVQMGVISLFEVRGIIVHALGTRSRVHEDR